MTTDLIGLLLAQTQPASLNALQQWVTGWKIHPVLVNFTAALIPVSIFSDLVARSLHIGSLRVAGWWTMLYAALITPFTALAGWLFWMSDDNGDKGMMIHKWLGTGLAVVFVGLLAWRAYFQAKNRPVSWLYLLAGLIAVGTLIYQGVLGGNKVFGGM